MFKNASIYKITLPTMLLATFNELASSQDFHPCGSTQDRSVGWVPPRGHEHGALVESVGGHLIMSLMIETKTVPGGALREAVEAKCKAIETQTGRKPGKKEKREIADDTKLALLPNAFPARSATWVWIDPERCLLAIDSASQARCDDVLTMLVRMLDGVVVTNVSTQTNPSAAMAMWLVDNATMSDEFSIGRETKLKACDESKAVVRYAKHSLDIDEVRQHIRMGKMPTKLALSYDDRVSFVLTSSMQVTGLKFLDPVFEDRASDASADRFDADVAILTGELGKMIPDLVKVLGGEVVA